MGKIAIVIQGASTNVDMQKLTWCGFKDDVIFSTWIGSESYYNADDVVIYSETPKDSGPMNINYQIKSTLNGLYKAKELGYDYVLKLRSDIVPTNPIRFLETLVYDKFNFLCWHAHEVYPGCPGYLIDYLMSGKIDDMIKLWDIDNIFCTVPEIILTKKYTDLFSMDDVIYFLDKIDHENNLFWIKRNLYLDTYKITISDPYNKYTFNNSIEYLNSEYIKKIII